VILEAKYEFYLSHGNRNQAEIYYQPFIAISLTLSYLSLATNLFSCIIIGLVVRLVRNKVTEPVSYCINTVENERKLNEKVTASHVLLITAYTISSILEYNVAYYRGYTLTQSEKLQSAWAFFGAVLDIFLSCILWYITDISSSPLIIFD
jgi:hypothetical protein